MQIPAAMFIESAIDCLKSEDQKSTADKTKELREAAYAPSQSAEFVAGYLLGVKTVEVMALMQGKDI